MFALLKHFYPASLGLLIGGLLFFGPLSGCKKSTSPASDSAATGLGTSGVPNTPTTPPSIDQMGTVTTNSLGFREMAVTIGGQGYTFIESTADSFTIGLSTGLTNEQPERKIALETYWISKTLISVGQFKSFVTGAAYTTEAESGLGCTVYDTTTKAWANLASANYLATGYTQDDTHPVACVTWADTQAFCKWFSSQASSVSCNLPTEAQWEHAARGTDGRLYPFGNSLPTDGQANFADVTFGGTYTGVNGASTTLTDSFVATSPVTTMASGASPYGLLDMAGNLSEWCYDYMDENGYTNPLLTNPTGPSTGTTKVYRGGSWADNLGDSQAQLDKGHNIRSHSRAGLALKTASDQIGFRIVIGSGAVSP